MRTGVAYPGSDGSLADVANETLDQWLAQWLAAITKDKDPNTKRFDVRKHYWLEMESVNPHLMITRPKASS